MKTASDLIAKELRKNGITDIFMLTGYGAMYLNDSIQRNKINFYAARNEAAAPMMAEAYAKALGKTVGQLSNFEKRQAFARFHSFYRIFY